MIVYVVEMWEDIPYGEYLGIEGVYISKEEAESIKDDNYDYMVSKY